MTKTKESTNPFYAALLVLGIVFVVTACLYVVMMFKALQPATAPPSALMGWMEANGTWLLAGETVVLAILTFGAIGTDGYWTSPAGDSPPDDKKSA